MKRKKKVAILFIFILVIFVVFQIRAILNIHDIQEGDFLIPLQISGQNYIKTVSSQECPALIIFYRSSCPHCRYEIKQLNKNINKLKNLNVFLLTPRAIKNDSSFIKEFPKLENSANVFWGTIDMEKVKEKYGMIVFPIMLFFNEKGVLLKKWKGEIKFDNILKKMQMYLVPEQGKGE